MPRRFLAPLGMTNSAQHAVSKTPLNSPLDIKGEGCAKNRLGVKGRTKRSRNEKADARNGNLNATRIKAQPTL